MKESLLAFLKLHKARSLYLAGQLRQVADRLRQRSIRFATFKGPSLAASIYGDLSLRECNDIDIIVDDHQIQEAEGVLGSLGYKSIYANPIFRKTFLAYQGQIMLVGENPCPAVDLHWDFATKHVPFPIAPEEIWSNLSEIELGGQVVPTLGRSDLALYLAGHGTKEGWRCLGWVSDFAMLIERNPDLDWARLLKRARQRGCGRSVLLGVELAALLLGTRVNDDLLKASKRTEDPRQSRDAIVQRMRTEFPTPSAERFLGDLDLCESRLQKARAFAQLLVTRTVGDYESIPLPRQAWRVYYATRPFRLAHKTLMSITRSLMN
jgi:hypothetical protein